MFWIHYQGNGSFAAKLFAHNARERATLVFGPVCPLSYNIFATLKGKSAYFFHRMIDSLLESFFFSCRICIVNHIYRSDTLEARPSLVTNP